MPLKVEDLEGIKDLETAKQHLLKLIEQLKDLQNVNQDWRRQHDEDESKIREGRERIDELEGQLRALHVGLETLQATYEDQVAAHEAQTLYVRQLEDDLKRERERAQRTGQDSTAPRNAGETGGLQKVNVSLHSLISPWDGTDPRRPVAEFLEEFDRVAEAGHWTAGIQDMMIRSKCEGPARDYILGREKRTYVELRRGLIDRFSDPREFDKLERALADARMNPGETTRGYADRLQALGRRLKVVQGQGAMGGDDPLQLEGEAGAHRVIDQRVLAAFIRGLRRNVAAIVQNFQPATVEAAVVIAEPYEYNAPAARQDPQPKPAGVFVATEGRAAERGWQEIAAIGGGAPLSCHRCGQPGHLVRDCNTAPIRGRGAETREPPECYNCHQRGHIAAYCRNPKAQGSQGAPPANQTNQ